MLDKYANLYKNKLSIQFKTQPYFILHFLKSFLNFRPVTAKDDPFNARKYREFLNNKV